MQDTHSLAIELIRASGLALNDLDAKDLIVSHINVSKSDNFNVCSEPIKSGDFISNEDIVIKVVLRKETIKSK